ncbi:hypothetical protein GCM10017688_14000 [Streptomyces ramulosus]
MQLLVYDDSQNPGVYGVPAAGWGHRSREAVRTPGGRPPGGRREGGAVEGGGRPIRRVACWVAVGLPKRVQAVIETEAGTRRARRNAGRGARKAQPDHGRAT